MKGYHLPHLFNSVGLFLSQWAQSNIFPERPVCQYQSVNTPGGSSFGHMTKQMTWLWESFPVSQGCIEVHRLRTAMECNKSRCRGDTCYCQMLKTRWKGWQGVFVVLLWRDKMKMIKVKRGFWDCKSHASLKQHYQMSSYWNVRRTKHNIKMPIYQPAVPAAS